MSNKVTDTDWVDAYHYGISRDRAIALEGCDPPRGSAALFHFDRCTPAEQARVIAAERERLAEMIRYRKDMPHAAHRLVETDRRLGTKHYPRFTRAEYQERDGAIARLRALVTDLERRAIC